MARLFASGSTRHFRTTSGLLTTEPITIACWFRSSDDFQRQTLFCLGNDGTQGFWRFTINGNQGGDPLQCLKIGDSGGSANAVTSTGYTSNTWHHAAATFTDDTNRAVFIDGGSKGTNVSIIANPTPDFTNIGAQEINAVSTPFSGRIAEVGLWNVALTDDEIVALASGVSPLRIRPTNLVGYWPLPAVTGDAIDYSGNGNDLTDTNTVGIADHSPTAPVWGFDPEWQGEFAAAASTNIDTQAKRMCALGAGRPFVRANFPVAAKDAPWRMSVGNVYCGNALDVSAAANPHGPLGHPLYGALAGPIAA